MVHAGINDISEDEYNRLKEKTMAKKKKKDKKKAKKKSKKNKKKESTKNDNSWWNWKNSKTKD